MLMYRCFFFFLRYAGGGRDDSLKLSCTVLPSGTVNKNKLNHFGEIDAVTEMFTCHPSVHTSISSLICFFSHIVNYFLAQRSNIHTHTEPSYCRHTLLNLNNKDHKVYYSSYAKLRSPAPIEQALYKALRGFTAVKIDLTFSKIVTGLVKGLIVLVK